MVRQLYKQTYDSAIELIYIITSFSRFRYTLCTAKLKASCIVVRMRAISGSVDRVNTGLPAASYPSSFSQSEHHK